jgi:hypothetical protein
VYITIGDGGNREGLATKWLAQTPVSAYRMATYGHGELEVVNVRLYGKEQPQQPRQKSHTTYTPPCTTGHQRTLDVAHQPRRGEQNGGRAVDCEGAGLLMRLYFEAPTE